MSVSIRRSCTSVRQAPRPLAACLAVAALLLTATALQAQSIETQVDSMSQRLEKARADHLQLISPRHFERAADRLADAQQRLKQGGRIEQIRQRLQDASRELDQARKLLDVGQLLLKDALSARSDALSADAPKFAPDLWKQAESKIREAGRAVEDGNQNEARQKSGEATDDYRQAQLKAIKADVLGRARDARSRALAFKPQDRAPVTFGRADSLLRQAEQMLTSDPSRQSEASQLAEEATVQFHHAARLAAVADSVQHDPDVEKLILRHERLLTAIADSLNLKPTYVDGLAPVTGDIESAIASLHTDRKNLQSELASLHAELDTAQSRQDSLEQQLAQLGQRAANVSAQLKERQRREQKLRQIRAIFDPNEAEVLLSGDKLIIRMFGIQFPSGSAEIKPENFSLLTKLQQVIREFPDAGITIAGNTDSRGDEDTNQALSQKRANAVRDYLLANMSLDAGRVTAVGYGENQPIATNDTEQGRAKNRRIDVTIDLSSDAGAPATTGP